MKVFKIGGAKRKIELMQGDGKGRYKGKKKDR